MRNKDVGVPWRLRGTEELEERQLMEAERGRGTQASPFCLPPRPLLGLPSAEPSWQQLRQEPETQLQESALCRAGQSRAGRGLDRSAGRSSSTQPLGNKRSGIKD